MSDFAERAGLARRFYQALDDGSGTALGAVLHDDVVDHDPMPGSAGGKEGLLLLLQAVTAAFSERRHVFEVLEPLGDDGAVVVWTMTGRHTGEFLGVPATGRRVRFKGIDVIRVRDGRIAEQHHVEQLLQVVGALQNPGGTTA